MKAIAKMARELGRTPSLAEFAGRLGISSYHVMRIFSTWNQAVRVAGLQPGRLYKRLGLDELLKDWGKAVRKKGGLPSRLWYQTHGRHYSRTFKDRFGTWDAVPAAFLKFAEGKPEWNNVVGLVERAVRPTYGRLKSFRGAPHTRLKGRAIYGNPMSFRGMRYEPANEQGVVLLFGMIAEELGYIVESAQTAFPDCEAKRRVGPDKWQHVRIEFEFESRNFLTHEHPWRGCDVIVCWRHNWNDCPKEIEVVELAEMLRR